MIEKFSESLRSLVDCHPIKKKDLAAKVRLSRTGLFKILSGKTLPKKSRMKAFLDVLDLGVEEQCEIERLYSSARLSARKGELRTLRVAKDHLVLGLTSDLDANQISYSSSEQPEVDIYIEGPDRSAYLYVEQRIVDHHSLFGRICQLKLERWGEQDIQRHNNDYVCIPTVTERDKCFKNLFNFMGISIIELQDVVDMLTKQTYT